MPKAGHSILLVLVGGFLPCPLETDQAEKHSGTENYTPVYPPATRRSILEDIAHLLQLHYLQVTQVTHQPISYNSTKEPSYDPNREADTTVTPTPTRMDVHDSNQDGRGSRPVTPPMTLTRMDVEACYCYPSHDSNQNGRGSRLQPGWMWKQTLPLPLP